MNAHAEEIFRKTLAKLDVGNAVRGAISVGEDAITISGKSIALHDLERVLIVSVGKAGATMFVAARDQLAASGLPVEALVVTPEGSLVSSPGVVVLHGAHPTPDVLSRQAAEAALALLERADAKTFVLFLISGGASAMLELPLDRGIAVEDVARFYEALVASGLPIEKMNTIRKHFSAVKGGRLALAAAGAGAQATLLLSDVPVDALSSVASGPSMPDPSTLEEARVLLGGLALGVPASVAAFFASPDLPETPKEGHRAFARATFEAVLSSEHMATMAAEIAGALGYAVLLDSSCDEQPYEQAAEYLLGRLVEHAAKHKKACLISVGEVAVTITGAAGRGGRNQQFALYCARELAIRRLDFTVLSAGSDGIDGHSPAAGAVVDGTSWQRAMEAGVDPAAALTGFDSYTLFEGLGDALITGPTGNNLRDLRVFLSEG